MNKKLLGKIKFLVIVVIICLFIWYLVISPMITFHKNEDTIKKAALRYFELNKNQLPTGERVKTLSLNALYKKSYLKEDFYIPYSNKTCSINNSWVKVKRDKNGEYQYYVYLECGVLKSSIDHDGPVIKLNGSDKVTLTVGDKYKDEGVKSVYDASDGKLNKDIVTVKSDVNTSKVGSYKVTYTAYDSLNNKSVVTRDVEVVRSIKSIVEKDLGDKLNYTGDVKNNYVRISNMYFRIYGYTEDKKNIILVSDEDISNVSFTKIDEWLDYYYKKLNDFTKKNIVKNKFCNMTVDETNINTVDCSSYTKERNVYVPSIVEVNRAQEDKNNFMKPKTISWTANNKDDKEAYVTRNVFSDPANKGKSFITYDNTMNFGVRPMFAIKGSLLVRKGDGTVEKPYEFGDTKPVKFGNKLSEREIGEYVNISGVLYRIVELMKDGTTKVISMDSLGTRNRDDVAFYSDPDAKNVVYDPKNKRSVGYFINNGATEYVDTSNFVNHEVEIPIYKDAIIYGTEVETKKYTVKLAAPNMFEMFSARGKHYSGDYKLYSYWMTNSSKTKRLAGAMTDTGVPVNEEIVPYWRFGIRVVAYVNKNRVVVSGDGSYFSPYMIK